LYRLSGGLQAKHKAAEGLREEKKWLGKLEYIHDNPVKQDL